jgi:integrase
MYLERRRRLWYAFHDIPQDAQAALGRKRFAQGLKTEDRKTAERRAAVLAVRWRNAIEQARTGSMDHVERDAMFWRQALRDAPDEHQRELVLEFLGNEAKDRIDLAALKAGFDDPEHPAIAGLPAAKDATRFYSIAIGEMVRLDEHLEEYLATLTNEAKTIDMKRSTLRRFCDEFKCVADVERKDVQRWINGLSQDGKKPATIQRTLSELRGYWSYLVSIDTALEDRSPFDKLTVPKPGKNGKADERKPFDPADVVKLHRAAIAREDQPLADLIELAMWTGARIEELCGLRLDRVHRDHVEIADAKTPAGWRQVPIHSKLNTTVARLRKDSSDGYLLSGLAPNKYGDRSNAVGKRFGRLKASHSFGEALVFHSIRGTVATLLENAGVLENVAADIIGHEKPTMTYGLYSGGASLSVKREAIEKLAYPGFAGRGNQ